MPWSPDECRFVREARHRSRGARCIRNACAARDRASRRSASTIALPACRRPPRCSTRWRPRSVRAATDQAALIAMDNPAFYSRHAQEPRHAVDQPRPDGVRAAQRLHRDRDRHGPRRRAVQHRCSRATSCTSAAGLGLPAVLAGEQRPLRSSWRRSGVNLLHRRCSARRSRRVYGTAAGGDRRRHHVARRRAGVLHRRHQPRDVPLHAAEPPVPRHGAGAGHVASAGPHPPGREPQPRRRQPPVPQQLHRLPQRHGPDGAGLRVLRLRRRRRAASSTRGGSVQPKYFINDTTLQAGLRHARRPLGQPLAHRARTRCSAGTRRCRAAGNGAKSLGQELGAQRCLRDVPGREGVPAPSASARRATRPTAARSTSMASVVQASGYRLKQVFAEAAAYCMGD